jgi:integral membrane sensor domain MASE1
MRPLGLKPETLILILVVFAAYIVTARIGLSLYAVNIFATFVWPPTGIALAALLLYDYDLWPGIALGALFINLSIGASPISAIGIAAGNTLEALAGAYFLYRLGFDRRFGRLRDAAWFIAACALAPVVAATIGVGSLVLAGNVLAQNFGPTWLAWWVGDALGALVFAPLILTWFSKGIAYSGSITFLEGYALAVCVIIVNLFVFWSSFGTEHHTLIYLVVFPLIWSSLRFGPRGKSFAIFATSIIAISATVLGHGPFASADVSAALLSLQTFVGTIAIVFLVFASVAEERARAREELELYIDKLERVIQESRG